MSTALDTGGRGVRDVYFEKIYRVFKAGHGLNTLARNIVCLCCTLTSLMTLALQAMFEVVTTEATYLRSLDVLIEHFMEDPGMNPDLPEGRRVLDKRQHHVIFSNVQEVREVSAR